MDIFKIAVIGLLGVACSSAVKAYKPDMAIYIVIGTVLILFGFVFSGLTSVFELFDSVYNKIHYGRAFFPILLKTLAVGYVADLTAQLCRDAGENAIAGKVELAGKVIIFCLAAPVMMSLMDTVTRLLPA